MIYVYLLKSEKYDWTYVGMTKNLKKRIDQHNKGRVRSTRLRRPYKIVYYEEVRNRKEAREKEKYYKSNAGKEYLCRRNVID